MNMDAYTYSSYWKDLHVRHAGALSAVGYCGLGEGFNQASYRLRRQALRRLERVASGGQEFCLPFQGK